MFLLMQLPHEACSSGPWWQRCRQRKHGKTDSERSEVVTGKSGMRCGHMVGTALASLVGLTQTACNRLGTFRKSPFTCVGRTSNNDLCVHYLSEVCCHLTHKIMTSKEKPNTVVRLNASASCCRKIAPTQQDASLKQCF